ncbi:MAG TPA: dihydrolipoamide acetyltransferase family protein, partial [Opitutus sp.]|nr:dihydrolipoamide acetyltransferase family protein [Opitutus sp.]
TLLKIFAADGSQVAIGDPLCAIGKPGEKIDAPAPKSAAPAPAQSPADDAKVSAPGASTTSKNEVEARPTTEPKADAKAAAASAPAQKREGGRIKISPLARKLAEEKGIDPADVTGSGPGGRIVRADIEAASKAPRSEIANRKSQIGALGAKGPVQEERTVPVSNMRGAIARRLVESKTQYPHFYVEVEIDAAPLLALREQLNSGLEKEVVKLSVNDFILKASAEALRRVPQVNASWETAASGQGQIRYFGAAHVAFAVAMEDGLITPVIRDAHQKSVFQISTEAKSLGKLAKDKKLKPDQFTGGTFCVSNMGMMGVQRFSAIINPPNAAILAVGTTVKKPVVKNDQIVIGQAMVLTLSCDHRVVDGAVGAQYLAALKQILEAPALLLV